MSTTTLNRKKTLHKSIMIGYDHDYTDAVIVRMPRVLFAMTEAYTPFEVEELSDQMQQGFSSSPQHTRMKGLLKKQFADAA